MPKINVVAWNVIISGYVSTDCYFEALGIFSDMKDASVNPDSITFTSSLASCSQLTTLEKGRDIHNSITARKLESNEIVMAALLDMYAKCGAVNEALGVFNQLADRDLISWTSMIMSYGSHGEGFEDLKLFRKMRKLNIKPDRVTFLAVILACIHGRLVDEGCYYFNMMLNRYGIQPSIAEYSCLIDLLRRAVKLHEAYGILQRTESMRDDVGLLRTLLFACQLQGNVELGEKITDLLIDKDPDDPGIYIILANMYASTKKWDEARKVRLKIGRAWFEKESWV